MPPRLLRRLLVAVALGALIALALGAAASIPATLEALARFRWRLLPGVVLAVVASWALRFVKWHYYLGCLAVPLAWRWSLLVFLSGFTMAISPGKLGEVLKAVLVRGLVGADVSRTASAVMAERLTDVAGLLALSALGATALPHGPLVLGALGAVVVLAVAAVRLPALGLLARRLLPAWVVDPARAFVHGGRTLLAPGALAAGLALSIASWFLECAAFALILGGLEIALPLRVATFLYAFASLAGAASMLPGGLGVAEASLAALLVSLGAPVAAAAGATLLVRLLTLWLAVLLGTATVLLAFRGTTAGNAPTA